MVYIKRMGYKFKRISDEATVDNKINDYIVKQIKHHINDSNMGDDAYIWIVGEIDNYERVDYYKTDYSNAVLKILKDIYSQIPSNMENKSKDACILLLINSINT